MLVPACKRIAAHAGESDQRAQKLTGAADA
jgi:hypothetical protein